MKALLTSSAILLVLGAPASLAKSGCADRETQTGITMCQSTEYAKSDGAMTAVYNRLRKHLGPGDAASRLRDAQRAWIAYRDAWCHFETINTEKGSMHPTVVASCLIKLTNEQTERLTYQLTCTGDTDCVGG